MQVLVDYVRIAKRVLGSGNCSHFIDVVIGALRGILRLLVLVV